MSAFHTPAAGLQRGSPRLLAPKHLYATALVLTVGIALSAGSPAGPGPVTVGAPPGGAVAIPRIQGASHVSPLLGESVVTTGVVTAVDTGGFYLQDPSGDGRPATSDALFVSTGSVAGALRPAVGDLTRVAGRVREFVPGGAGTHNLSVTRLEAGELEILAGGHPLPEPVVLGSGGRIPPNVHVISADELPVDLRDPDQAGRTPFEPDLEGIDFYESLEGMRVTVRRPVAVSPTRSFGEAGSELSTLPDRGEHVAPEDARTLRDGILLQPAPDNRGDQNPERVTIRSSPGLTPGTLPRLPVGSRLESVTGVMGYAFGDFRVVATGAVAATPAAVELETTDLRGTPDRVTVATYNVHNLNPLPETARRMSRIGIQIAAHLASPDVVALQEIQDANGTRGGPGDTLTDASATLRALADAVHRAGGPRYEFIDVPPRPNTTGGVPGGNIRNAFLYDPRRLELVEYGALTPAVLEGAGVARPDAFRGGRDPLAASFSFRGGRFTVINNHFTSRTGSTPVFGAVHPFVQAGESAREAQSRAIHDYVASRLSGRPGAAVVVLGDLNTFEWTDDLTRILPGAGEGGGILENLVLRVPRAERYSYNFRGNSQATDHVFVTGALRRGAEIDIVHLNADLPADAGAASDHDPVLVRVPIPGAG